MKKGKERQKAVERQVFFLPCARWPTTTNNNEGLFLFLLLLFFCVVVVGFFGGVGWLVGFWEGVEDYVVLLQKWHFEY